MKADEFDVYHDVQNHRLVYVGARSDPDFWDQQWTEAFDEREFKRPYAFVVWNTEKYLPKGSKIIDAGCGTARSVRSLKLAGYEAYGIDNANRTVTLVNRVAPELDVKLGDVRSMTGFPDGFFDGLWSLGVIEHFYDGYGAIIDEIRRVVRPGGYAFVTVPSLSPLRRLKFRLGMYPKWKGQMIDQFYQFILDPKKVIADFEARGFRTEASSPRGGYFGLMSESGSLRPLLDKLYRAKPLPFRTMRIGLDRLLGPLSSHTRLYVFRRL